MRKTMSWAVLAGLWLVAGCYPTAQSDVPPDPVVDPVEEPRPLPTWTDLQMGGPLADEVTDLAVRGEALFVAGYQNGIVGVSNVEPIGDAAGFVKALRIDGKPVWERTFDTAAADTVEALLVDKDGVFFAGRTSGAFPGFENAGQMDAFVGRLPADGSGDAAILQLGDERPQHPNGLGRDAEGALLVSGFDDVFLQGSAVSAWEDPLSARVHTRGGELELDWLRRRGSIGSDWYRGVLAPGPAGELIAVGHELTGPGKGPFAERFGAGGEVLWRRQLGHVGIDAASAIARGPDGLVYVAGSTFEVVGAQAYGGQDAFVVVLDPETGTVVRAMQAGSAGADWVRDIAIDEDGNVYVTGGTSGALPGAELAGASDAFLVRFDDEGVWTGAWQRGTPGWDEAAAVAVDARGHVFVGGETEGALVEGAVFGGERDAFVVRLADDDLTAP